MRVLSRAVLGTVEAGRVLTGHSVGENLEMSTLETVSSGWTVASTALLIAWEALSLLLVCVVILWALVFTCIPVPIAHTFVANVCVETVS